MKKIPFIKIFFSNKFEYIQSEKCNVQKMNNFKNVNIFKHVIEYHQTTSLRIA
jgi:hypothetical protein